KSTAGAIMSLAYLEPHPILDGNVKRVISRFLKKELDLLKETELWNLSEEMVNRDDCFSYTQGIMDLGATICTPTNPSCSICPVSSQCLSAFKVKSIKKNKAVSAKKVIVMNLSLVQTDQSFLLAKNEVDSIWKNLWLPFNSESLKNYAQNFKLISNQKIKHELTHRILEIHLKTYFSSKEYEIKTNQRYQWIKKDRIDEYGLPKPITKVIKEL
ncbi:NUDIX domain-containing protein, partial [Gammaproteobacteria bacterium]|nr:NUDIX domain-containing protein [Gammaproteobacteria bacterium]